MRISIDVGGRVVVTASQIASDVLVDAFVAKHVEWIKKHLARARLRTVVRISRKDVATLKQKARVLAESRCAHFAKMYGFSYGKISIRAQKLRWGSCSVKGNLNFNYKIVVLPAIMSDYIIVHEVCHLAQMNHSKIFWNLVKQTMPNCMELRNRLRKTHVTMC